VIFENVIFKIQDMWDDMNPNNAKHKSVMDWDPLRKRIKQHGLRNSLLVAPMPTASTSQILGVNECIEPYTSNMYVRRVKSGEFIITNPHLLQDLTDLGIWNDDVRNQLMRDHGSVKNIAGIPEKLKSLYKTVWEMSMKDIIDMAADRGKFIDQSQSLNLFVAAPTKQKLTAMHFHGWERGLKTGMYYLRSKAAADAIQFTVDNGSNKGNGVGEEEPEEGKDGKNGDEDGNGGSENGGDDKSEMTSAEREFCDNFDEENNVCLSCQA